MTYDGIIKHPDKNITCNISKEDYQMSPERYQELSEGINAQITTQICDRLHFDMSKSTYVYNRLAALIHERDFISARRIVDDETISEVKTTLKQFFMEIILTDNSENEDAVYQKFPFSKSKLRLMDYDTFIREIDNYLVSSVLNGSVWNDMTVGELLSNITDLWKLQSEHYDKSIYEDMKSFTIPFGT